MDRGGGAVLLNPSAGVESQTNAWCGAMSSRHLPGTCPARDLPKDLRELCETRSGDRVSSADQTTTRIHWERPVQVASPRTDPLSSLPLRTEAKVFQVLEFGIGRGVVDFGDLHVVRREATKKAFQNRGTGLAA